MIDAANPPMPVMPGAPARQQANDGAERARPRRVQQDHFEDFSRKLSGMLRYGNRGFSRYMDRDTGYAMIADIASQLRREESEIRYIAMASRNSEGPRFEAEERAGVLFIRATKKRKIRTRRTYVHQFHDPVNDAYQDSVNHKDLAGNDDAYPEAEDDVGSDAGPAAATSQPSISSCSPSVVSTAGIACSGVSGSGFKRKRRGPPGTTPEGRHK